MLILSLPQITFIFAFYQNVEESACIKSELDVLYTQYQCCASSL